jgi:hypothetical protein
VDASFFDVEIIEEIAVISEDERGVDPSSFA